MTFCFRTISGSAVSQGSGQRRSQPHVSVFQPCDCCDGIKIFLLWAWCENKVCRVKLIGSEMYLMPPILQSYEVLVNRKSTRSDCKPVFNNIGFIWILPCFLINVLSLFQDSVQGTTLIELLYLLCPLRSTTISQSFFIFVTVSILRSTSPISCRMSSILGLSDVVFSCFS